MIIPLFKALASFGLVTGAAVSNGKLARLLKLPVITGFLITGVLAGPSLLGFISEKEITLLQPVDHVALGMIAIAAGSEFSLRALQGRWRAVIAMMLGLVSITLITGTGLTLLFRDMIPFLSELNFQSALAASLLIGTIMVARSPSAAIAIIKETGARGPFTQLILGVTVLMDVVVIILFALSLSIAHNLIDHQGSVLRLAAEVSIEIFSSLIVGIFFALILGTLLYDRRGAWARPLGVVISSALVFFITAELQHSHLHLLGFPVHIEPLLACLTIGVWINNVGTVGEELEYELHRLAPLVYVTFFTITGASLNLELLALVWPAALLLFVIRLIGIGLGSVVGGMIASEPREQHRYRWMGFVTQAGVGLGLAERVSHEFPDWGERFAVLMIAVIVLNEMIGPLFFKRAVVRSGEVGLAHAQSESSEALSEEEAHMNSTESSPTAST